VPFAIVRKPAALELTVMFGDRVENVQLTVTDVCAGTAVETPLVICPKFKAAEFTVHDPATDAETASVAEL
jgi:hypothetical protein